MNATCKQSLIHLKFSRKNQNEYEPKKPLSIEEWLCFTFLFIFLSVYAITFYVK